MEGNDYISFKHVLHSSGFLKQTLLTVYRLEPEGEWSFEAQVRKQNIPLPESLTLNSQQVRSRGETAIAQRDVLYTKAVAKYVQECDKKNPGFVYDHKIWCQGWEVGYSDAFQFFQMRSTGKLGAEVQDTGGDRIGCLEIWIKKRCKLIRIFAVSYTFWLVRHVTVHMN